LKITKHFYIFYFTIFVGKFIFAESVILDVYLLSLICHTDVILLLLTELLINKQLILIEILLVHWSA